MAVLDILCDILLYLSGTKLHLNIHCHLFLAIEFCSCLHVTKIHTDAYYTALPYSRLMLFVMERLCHLSICVQMKSKEATVFKKLFF